MAMLYMPNPWHTADLDAWFKPSALRKKEQALFVLDRLHIIASNRNDAGKSFYTLSPIFQRSLRQSLEGSGTQGSFGIPASREESGDKTVSVKRLDMYSREQWEAILYYLVSGAAGLTHDGTKRTEVSAGTKKLLHAGELVRTIHGSPRITKDGFSFVLQETNAQVWSLLIVYLKMANPVGSFNLTIRIILTIYSSVCPRQKHSPSSSCWDLLSWAKTIQSHRSHLHGCKCSTTSRPWV